MTSEVQIVKRSLEDWTQAVSRSIAEQLHITNQDDPNSDSIINDMAIELNFDECSESVIKWALGAKNIDGKQCKKHTYSSRCAMFTVVATHRGFTKPVTISKVVDDVCHLRSVPRSPFKVQVSATVHVANQLNRSIRVEVLNADVDVQIYPQYLEHEIHAEVEAYWKQRSKTETGESPHFRAERHDILNV